MDVRTSGLVRYLGRSRHQANMVERVQLTRSSISRPLDMAFLRRANGGIMEWHNCC